MAGAAVLLLPGHRSDAQAQTFNDAIQGALDGGGGGACNGLKGGPFQGSLNSICASPYPVPEGRARGYTLRDYDVVCRAIYSNPNNGLNAEGSGVNGFVAGLCRRVQEGLQVLSDDLMEHGVLGVARPVDHLVEGHGPPRGGTAPTRIRMREWYTEQSGDGGGRTAAGGASTFRNGGEGGFARGDRVV